jgi:hypothetical protein
MAVSITVWAVAIYCVVGFVSCLATIATMRGTHLGHSVGDTVTALWKRLLQVVKTPEVELEYPPRIPVRRHR